MCVSECERERVCVCEKEGVCESVCERERERDLGVFVMRVIQSIMMRLDDQTLEISKSLIFET